MRKTTGQHPHRFSKEVTFTGEYLLYLPEGYRDSSNEWPLIFFLHGAGERGADISKLEGSGLPRLLRDRSDFPFVVLSPQCPAGQWWSSVLLITLLDDIVDAYRIDRDRVYVTGLSMGGYATWNLACRYPDRFAAAVPICGGGNPHLAQFMKDIPTWIFHGAEDDIVSIGESERMVAALREAGGNVEFTVYPDTGHDSWTETYDNPALYHWLLSHTRKILRDGQQIQPI